MYQIERQDQLYKTLPHALFFSPTIVIFSALTLLLPLSGVFAPSSLTVSAKNSTNISGPCIIPTGNLSTPNTPDYSSLHSSQISPESITVPYVMSWGRFTPKATTFITKLFLEHRIPDLPQSCGPNCRYNVSVPSFIFQCTPNPSWFPPSPGGGLWNAILDPGKLSDWKFYISWKSWNETGTLAENASCLAVQAQYDVEVRVIPLSISLSLILKMSTQGQNERRCPIC